MRPEAPGDATALHLVHTRAFPTSAEARLVDALRGRTAPQVSLVAEHAAQGVVGHVLFTPVEIHAPSGVSRALGLAPLAVAPAHQRQGVGSALVRAGLDACRGSGTGVVVVLGHPDYYPRFGFEPAWRRGLWYREPGENPAFQVCELEPGALRGRSGEVRYHPAFG